jgi:AcrR family transcriptional regulator
MSEISTVTSATDTRGHILDCAEVRFRTFGYGKSTMAEIAGDAHMSAANLYRYFDNKQELGVACAKRCMDELFAALRAVVRRGGSEAADTLVAFAVELARWTHSNTANEPRINELVQMITSERKDVVVWRESRLHGLIAEILARGNDSGEFDIEDVIDTAQTVHAALMLFQLPLLMGMYELDELEARAAAVATLVLRGLQVRA